MTKGIQEQLRSARERAQSGGSRRAVLDRLDGMINQLERQAGAAETPARTRDKIVLFLSHLEQSHATLGSRTFQVAFAINVVGEGMARADFVHRAAVEFIQVGLYFYGLEQIERRWAAQAPIYSGVHADHLGEFLGRSSLKELLADARQRLADGRVFCLTYAYLNSLRKAYWQRCRKSEDALDVALSGPLVEGDSTAVEQSEAPESEDRVQLMLHILDTKLSPRQKWIYLAKNRAGLLAGDGPTRGSSAQELLASMFAEAGLEGGNLTWSEIADRLDINEKSAKREYLRALHLLLKESADAVFGGERIPSGYVRRILEQIRSVVYEKDLRIREKTGRGLTTLVSKWEVALRFVLNHARVGA